MPNPSNGLLTWCISMYRAISLKQTRGIKNWRRQNNSRVSRSTRKSNMRKYMNALPFLSTVKKKKTLMYRASSIKFYYKSTSILSRVLFSDWPRYPLIYFVLVEFYWYTNADAVIWLAEPLHTISHSSPLFSDSDSHVTRLCSSAETQSAHCARLRKCPDG